MRIRGRGGIALRQDFFSHYGRQLGTLSGLLGLVVVLWALTPHFLTISNLLNIAEQATIIAIVAVGMTFVIITGGIDLSVGSVLAFAGVVMASAHHGGVPLPLALLVGLGVGLLCGLVNGLLITIGRLPPFIATLGMMSVARGAALMFTEGRPISGFPESFRSLATGEVLRIPTPVIIMIVVYVIAHFVLRRTKLGRYTYAIGGNEEAALLSGINVRVYKSMVYGIAGMLYELDAIAATVIGGTSLLGGEGTVVGTLIGALIMAVLRNGLNLLSVSSFFQQVVIGSVIILAVLIDMALKKRGK